MSLSIENIEHAFFEAMGNGYAQDAEEATILELPGSKVLFSNWGDYSVVDSYLVTPHSNKSAGQTLICHKGIPVWTMYYGGEYAEIAIPFLKECLHRAYVTERRFYGGRGPHFIRGDRFTYVNHINRNLFDDFEGEEFVFDLSEECFGRHWYRGMSLL